MSCTVLKKEKSMNRNANSKLLLVKKSLESIDKFISNQNVNIFSFADGNMQNANKLCVS